MSRPSDEILLAFLEGRLDDDARHSLLDELDTNRELAAELREAAAGLARVGGPPAGGSGPEPATAGRTRRMPWPMLAAIAATLALSIPGTVWLTREPTEVRKAPTLASGQPLSPKPAFVLVLHGRWPDMDRVDETEARRRAAEYWSWTSSLADDHVLLAAGDLRWEAGERLGPDGIALPVSAEEVDDPTYPVGMLAVRADTYAEALALARDCPHLRYGGSISVRRVGAGFVTSFNGGDWGSSP